MEELQEYIDILNKAFTEAETDNTILYAEEETINAFCQIKKKNERKYARFLEKAKKLKCKMEVKKAVIVFSQRERFSENTHLSPSSTLDGGCGGDNTHLTPPLCSPNTHLIDKNCLIEMNDEGKISVIEESKAASIITKQIKKIIALDTDAHTWFVFLGTHWKPLANDSQIKIVLTRNLYVGADEIGFSNAYKNGIMSLIEHSGFLETPQNNYGILPFKNGIVDINTKILSPITCHTAQTWVLPYDYNPESSCNEIKNFLHSAVDGDLETVEFLRAWLAALLHGRADLQIFLHLLGSGGTGKGTFMRLATALIGETNAASTTLDMMEKNQFETANFYNKRLVKVTDSDKYGGSIDTLKAMTGQDHLRLERKHQQQSGGFIFGGMVVIASNEPLAFTDRSSGLERRRTTVIFNNRVPNEQRIHWQSLGGEEVVLHSELGGLVNWLLELSQDDISRVIKTPPERIQKANLEAMQEGNPIIDWFNDTCISDLSASTQIGQKEEIREQGKETTFKNDDTWLYASYCLWSQRNNKGTLSLRRFSSTLIDSLTTLKIEAKKVKKGGRMWISGIRLKKKWEIAKSGIASHKRANE